MKLVFSGVFMSKYSLPNPVSVQYSLSKPAEKSQEKSSFLIFLGGNGKINKGV